MAAEPREDVALTDFFVVALRLRIHRSIWEMVGPELYRCVEDAELANSDGSLWMLYDRGENYQPPGWWMVRATIPEGPPSKAAVVAAGVRMRYSPGKVATRGHHQWIGFFDKGDCDYSFRLSGVWEYTQILDYRPLFGGELHHESVANLHIDLEVSEMY